MYTAQNLGFDAICVGYDNYGEQESICQAARTSDPKDCFTNITQTKLDYTGYCIKNGPQWDSTHCGLDTSKDGGTKEPYYVMSYWDAVVPRIVTMLQYLCVNGYDAGNTKWESYLASGTCTSGNDSPNWGKMMMAGFSQGGDMATFAGYKNRVVKVINLSAPPQATVVNNVQTAAAYFSGLTPATNIRSIYGLVSTNDSHYWQLMGSPPTSVYQAVWQALGYNLPANHDSEENLKNSNLEIDYRGISCNSGTPSHNFSSSALERNGGDGHDDTLRMWNEDIYVYMLLN
jgi:hypothetical protein